MDFELERVGEVALLRALTDRAVRFLDTEMRGAMRNGNAVVLESYQVVPTLSVAQLERLTVRVVPARLATPA